MSTFSRLASSAAFRSGRTLKPTMMAFDAAREQDVGFRDRADAGMEDSNLHLVGAQLVQHFAQCFLRSLDVALQNDGDFLDFAFGKLAVQLIESQSRGLCHCDFAQLFLAVLSDLPRLFVIHGLEGIAGHAAVPGVQALRPVSTGRASLTGSLCSSNIARTLP